MVAVVAGGSGLIGGHLLKILSGDNYFSKVIALTRKPLDRTFSSVEQQVVDLNSLPDLENAFTSATVIFSAIGTTNAQVKGDQDLYRSIDFDIPVNLANAGLRKGVRQFVLVSSVGADPLSKNFYLRLKGEVEDAISLIGFETVNILRPSVLLGHRKQSRPMEKVAQAAMGAVSRLMAGSLRKYRAISAEQVAAAMVEAAKRKQLGKHILCYDEITALAAQRPVR